MKEPLTLIYNRYGAVVIGFIGMLGLSVLWELSDRPVLLCAGVLLVSLAAYLARKTAHHFHHHHRHAADSAIDMVAPAVLLLANILHPAVDGFSLFQTFSRAGAVSAAIVGTGIVLHEILRQSALMTAFRPMGIRRHVVLITAVIGIGSGIALGVIESAFIERYEYVADLATVFAYSFVIAEYYYHNHGEVFAKRSWWLLTGGIVAVLLQHYLMAAH